MGFDMHKTICLLQLIFDHILHKSECVPSTTCLGFVYNFTVLFLYGK